MRFTGSLFVEACFFIGFLPGNVQNNWRIYTAINRIFPNIYEQNAFVYGYLLSDFPIMSW